MNSLYKQFERESNLDVYALGLDKAKWESRLEKFAELIVRECAGVTLDYKNNDHYTGWCDHAAEILKHFGVEE
jgi:hypothetical protein